MWKLDLKDKCIHKYIYASYIHSYERQKERGEGKRERVEIEIDREREREYGIWVCLRGLWGEEEEKRMIVSNIEI
jgi:hypothetical protein